MVCVVSVSGGELHCSSAYSKLEGNRIILIHQYTNGINDVKRRYITERGLSLKPSLPGRGVPCTKRLIR